MSVLNFFHDLSSNLVDFRVSCGFEECCRLQNPHLLMKSISWDILGHHIEMLAVSQYLFNHKYPLCTSCKISVLSDWFQDLCSKWLDWLFSRISMLMDYLMPESNYSVNNFMPSTTHNFIYFYTFRIHVYFIDI